MDSFLEPIQTKRIKDDPPVKPAPAPSSPTDLIIKDYGHALDVLRNQPDLGSLQAIVDYLEQDKEFDVKIPSSRATPIVQALVYDVIPNYWMQLLDDRPLKKLLDSIIECLRSLPALGAIISRLKALLSAQGIKGQASQSSFLQSQSICLIQLCERICEGNPFVADVWDCVHSHNGTALQKKLLWREFVALISSGKIISSISESEVHLNEDSNYIHRSWLANGVEYSKWLARNIGTLASLTGKLSTIEYSAQLLGRCLSLGYNGM
jgi:telomere length regulation protein